MKFPKKLKIGGHWVKVLFPYNFRERSDLFGQYNHNLKEIRLNQDDGNGNATSPNHPIVTFIHEILHAIDFTTGHCIFVDNEKALEGISEGIFQVLVDNGYLKLED